MKKILIIRFSSFGDIVQCTGVLPALKRAYPEVNIEWLTRSEFVSLLEINPLVNKVIGFDRSLGFWGLIKLGLKLRKNNFDLVFDAHNNLRSLFLRLIFFFSNTQLVVRSKFRFKRFMLFSMKKNIFNEPFMGIGSYLFPLQQKRAQIQNGFKVQSWNFPEKDASKIRAITKFEKFVSLAPSAAWEMKRWPLVKWHELIGQLPDTNFVVLGGPDDTFCQDLEFNYPDRVQNLAGQTNLIQSCLVVANSLALIGGDTGLLHVADVLGVKGIALIGPTACYPTSELIKTLEVNLRCKPCSKDGRGKCIQSVYQKCMVDITAENVAKTLNDLV